MTHRTPRPRTRHAIAAIVVTALCATTAVPQPARAVTIGLFFSEYIEGTGINRALEIYNGTAGTIDLDAGGYTVAIISREGAITSIPLEGSVASGDVFVIANPFAAAEVLAQADQQEDLPFSGDDVVSLGGDGVILDVIGQLGGPTSGTEWGTGLTSTEDNTLRRVPTVGFGDVNDQDPFDPALEWEGFPTDDASGLGLHTATVSADAGSVAVSVEFVPSVACIEVSTTSVSFGSVAPGAEDVPSTPDIGITNCGEDATLLARGSDAGGIGAAWSLVSSQATCADSLGLNNYRLLLAGLDLPDAVGLSTLNQTIQSLGATQSTTHTARLFAACPGSSGNGQTMAATITYIATQQTN